MILSQKFIQELNASYPQFFHLPPTAPLDEHFGIGLHTHRNLNYGGVQRRDLLYVQFYENYPSRVYLIDDPEWPFGRKDTLFSEEL
jgi:hypothetical protein